MDFKLPESINERTFKFGCNDEVKALCEFHDYNFYQYKGEQRIDKIARNPAAKDFLVPGKSYYVDFTPAE